MLPNAPTGTPPAPAAGMKEWNGEVIGAPVLIHAFVSDHHDPLVMWREDGRLRVVNDCDGEHSYAECEYGGLTGLVTFEGHLHTRAAFAAKGYGWPHSDEFDDWTTGKWRQMTADEAVSLGLISHPVGR